MVHGARFDDVSAGCTGNIGDLIPPDTLCADPVIYMLA
jgi:hypothetical protein